ncbi:MAG: NAD-dependent epimerase/dehydratase family protein [Bacteroidales bacterium]|nr:NAD-dependent epimerase/dehydratase family protein [Bacteroidales bacterium]
MKILITGIHGFVGSNLVKALAPRHTIYGLDIVAPETEGVVKTYSWDELDSPDFPRTDAVIHLAGKAHDTRNEAEADVYFKVNTGLTQRIFDWFEASPSAKKFVFFSTAKAAAECVPDILREDVTPTPVGPYGESKIQAEEYILQTLERQGVSRASMCSTTPGTERPANGKEVYIFRPCMIHGPGNKGNLNLLYGVVSKGIPWPLGAFDNKRTFTSVANVCTAVEGVLTKDVPSGIYNMGDDRPLSTNELIGLICGTLGKKARVWKLPKGMMNAMAKAGGALHLPLNPLRMQKLTENYVSSNAKIKQALGIDRFPVEAREGLITTIKSFANK